MATRTPTQDATVDEQLAWEARHRPRAGLAALAAGVLGLIGAVLPQFIFGGVPRSGLVTALERGLQTGPIDRLESLRVPGFEFAADRQLELIATGVVQAIALIALGWALAFLASVTRARRQELPRAALYLALIGAMLSALATLVYYVARSIQISDFLDGPRTAEAAREIGGGSVVLTAQLIGLPGTMALALGVVLISLNAQRAGVLTRFMGILGVIVGALMVFPIGSPVPVVQTFWLLAVGLLFLGRTPGGDPPAWRTGQAEPWASTRFAPPVAQESAEVAEPDGAEPARPAAPRQRKRKRRA